MSKKTRFTWHQVSGFIRSDSSLPLLSAAALRDYIIVYQNFA